MKEFDWNNSRLKDIYYQRDDYKDAETLSRFLHHPHFTIKQIESLVPNLSYRRINLWTTETRLISDSRTEDTGWRKFSQIDILKLQIITALREDAGIAIENIKTLMDKISSSTFSQSVEPKTVKVLELEYAYLKAKSGNKYSLLIDFREEPLIVLGTEAKTLADYLAIREGDSPMLILPFYRYVERMNKSIPLIENTTMGSVILKRHFAPSAKEQKLLDIIRKKQYEEISLVRKDGGNFIIRAKSHQRGSFSDKDVLSAINSKDFQSVTVSTVGGKKLTISQEETIKV